ncbi:MAG: GTP pyrophosphokinase family protein [Ruminococcus sp.]|jgi:putative GTP pyrophosphokinase|nr:GTP pyrophosphokinase family protein [Ruminococcus sp.]
MSEFDFYIEGIQHLPAIVDNEPDAKERIAQTFSEFVDLAHLYESAIEVVKTYLGILDSEFSIKFQRNPIHDIKSRMKSAESIVNKLQKKGVPLTPENARKNLLDIAGIRVTCYYISDIYVLAEMLSHRDDFVIIKQKDYIKKPKPSGYRSYHMIINVPVYLAAQKKYAPVEIQIRTIAMDFWASLEHQLRYKTSAAVTPEISQELKEVADKIAETDMQMQKIYMDINGLD